MDFWLPRLALATLGILHVTSASDVASMNCTFVERTIAVVHAGWPTAISCDNLVASSRGFSLRSSKKWPPAPNATCEVTNPALNKSLWNTTIDLSYGFAFHAPDFVTPDVDTNSTKLYHVILKFNSSCFYDVVQLNVTEHNEETCEQSQKRIQSHLVKGRKGDLRILKCQVSLDEETDIHLVDDAHNFTISWYRNCTKLQPDAFQTRLRMTGRELTITSLDYDISGLYSCVISYKQSSRFAAHFALCVQPATSRSAPTLRCPETAVAKVGGGASLTCQLHVGYQSINAILATFSWEQSSNASNTCSPFGFSRPAIGQGWGGRAKCYVNVSETQEHNNRCYLYEPSEEEKNAKLNTLSMTMEISDVRSSDFGEYTVLYERFSEKTEGKILLSEKSSRRTEYYIHIIVALSVALGLIIIGILIFVIVRCMKNRQIKA